MQCIYDGGCGVRLGHKQSVARFGRTGLRLKKWRKRYRTTRFRFTNKTWRGKCATSITARQIRDGCWPWYWLSAAKRSESLPRTSWMPGRRRITSPGAGEGSEGDEKETDRHAQVRQPSTRGGLVGQPRRPR